MTIAIEVFILFTVVLIGALARRLRYLTDETIRGITQLVVNITLPCLTIANMQRPFSADILHNFVITMVLSFLTVLICMGLGLLIFRKRPHARRAVLANLGAFSNCGFMGYPIILAINPDWMIYAVAYNISFTFACWTFGVMLYCGRENVDFRKALINPNTISAAIGFALFCMRVSLPSVCMRVLNLVGGLTTPLSMLLIGPRICGIHPQDFKDWDYHFSAALRLVAFPLIIYALLHLLPIAPAVASTIYLLTCMPSGTLVSMQAELYGGDAVFAARAAAYSTLLCMVTVPIMSMLL